MKKFFGFVVPLASASLVFGGLFYLVGFNQAAALSSPSAPQGSILVNTLDDELNTDGDCSLREAIAAANQNMVVDACPAGDALITDTIGFNSGGIITVTSQLSITAGGPLVIDGSNAISLSGGGSVRILNAGTGAHINITGLTLMYGNEMFGSAIQNNGSLVITDCRFAYNRGWAGLGINNSGTITVTHSLFDHNGIAYSGAAFYNGGTMTVIDSDFTDNEGGYGGAIGNSGSLSIISSTISSNTGDFGGGIYNSAGHLTLNNSLVTNNHVNQQGGGIFNESPDPFTILESTIYSNSSDYVGAGIYNNTNGVLVLGDTTVSENITLWMGGGIYNLGIITVTQSTIYWNVVGLDVSEAYGGGVHNSGTMFLINSTISWNWALAGFGGVAHGGGLNNYGKMMITNSTIAENTADDTSGIFIDYSGVLTITNSIVSNFHGGECNSALTDAGHNISSDSSCGFELANHSFPNTNPLLGAMQDNGGYTWTHALVWGSPAIDAGDDAVCPSVDQRGLPRPMDGDGDAIATCDIGAYELQAPLETPLRFYLPFIRFTIR